MKDRKRCPLGWHQGNLGSAVAMAMSACLPCCAWYVGDEDNGECCIKLMADTIGAQNSAYLAARGQRPL